MSSGGDGSPADVTVDGGICVAYKTAMNKQDHAITTLLSDVLLLRKLSM